MPVKSPIPTINGRNADERSRWIAGGAAGNLACTGILADDYLIEVGGFSLTEGTPNTTTPRNLTAEFTISAADQINNTGGTNTTGFTLYVRWATRAAHTN